LVQAFLKKWWVESDCKAPNLPLSLRLKVSGCHYNSIYNNTWTKQVKQLSNQRQTQWSKYLIWWILKRLTVSWTISSHIISTLMIQFVNRNAFISRIILCTVMTTLCLLLWSIGSKVRI
jgi:hypothetical protein